MHPKKVAKSARQTEVEMIRKEPNNLGLMMLPKRVEMKGIVMMMTMMMTQMKMIM